MANRNRDFGRTGFSQDPNQDYNWDPRGYRYDWENEEYRNRQGGRTRGGMQGRQYGEYPENYSSSQFRNDYYEDYDEDSEPTTWYYEEVWLVPGPYAGIGPRGYQRSDDDICQTVCERLASHGQLDASGMDVDVENGEVILKGDVPDRRTKKLAERIADTVSGVKDVRNELHINRHMSRGQQSQRLSTGYESGNEYATEQTNNAFQSTGTRGSRPTNLKEGQEVVGSQGKTLGTVKEVHQHDFVLNRPAAPDVHVPFTEIQDFSGNRVRLNVTSDQVDKQGWQHI